MEAHSWAVSSVGRAPALQAVGHKFDPCTAHQDTFLMSIVAAKCFGTILF